MENNTTKPKKNLGRPRVRRGRFKQITIAVPIWLCDEFEAKFLKEGYPSRSQIIEARLMAGCGYDEKTYAERCDMEVGNE